MKIGRRKFLKYTFLVFVFLLSGTIVCDLIIEFKVRNKIYSDINALPERKVGLLLGTSKMTRNGKYRNPYYTNRLEAAVELIHKGKVKYLIISGDNGRKTYSEPDDMRADLIAMGLDSSIIFLDFAGFRTFDSVIRLREIFSQTEVTVISQPFHNERAVFIAGIEGINAIGFNAKDVGNRFGIMVQIREKFARVKVFVDYMTFCKPKFLGPKVPIPNV